MADQIRTVPVYIAATKCWLARPESPDAGGPLVRMSAQHQDPCRFCDFGTDYLRMMIEEAKAWIDYNKQIPVTNFEKLSVAEQRRQVAAAAAVPDSLAAVSD